MGYGSALEPRLAKGAPRSLEGWTPLGRRRERGVLEPGVLGGASRSGGTGACYRASSGRRAIVAARSHGAPPRRFVSTMTVSLRSGTLRMKFVKPLVSP